MRTDKDTYFLDIALRCAHQGTCLRRNYGAVIVDNKNKIISTGYTGSPSGTEHCVDIGTCWRKENNIPSGTAYEKCRSVHAEQNALIQAGREANGAMMYIAGYEVETGEEVMGIPCFLCAKMIVNSGISLIVYRMNYSLFKIQPQIHYLELDKKIFEKR